MVLNNNILYSAIFFVIAGIVVPLQLNSHPAPTSSCWYKNLAQDCRYALYCQCNNVVNTTRTAATVASYIKLSPHSLAKHINSIKHTLKQHKLTVLEKEKIALNSIKNTFNISDTTWSDCINTIHFIKQNNKNAMLMPHADVKPNNNLPGRIQTIIKNLLEQNNINPQSIKIKVSTENNNHLAHVVWHVSNDSHANYEPAKIVFFSPAITAAESDLTAICAHEAEHIVQQHKVTKQCLIECIKKNTQFNYEEIIQSAEFQELIAIHEAQAEILPATKDPQLAYCFKKLREKSYYPNRLEEQHYYQLNSIYALWQLYEWLCYFQQKVNKTLQETIIETINSYKIHIIGGLAATAVAAMAYKAYIKYTGTKQVDSDDKALNSDIKNSTESDNNENNKESLTEPTNLPRNEHLTTFLNS